MFNRDPLQAHVDKIPRDCLKWIYSEGTEESLLKNHSLNEILHCVQNEKPKKPQLAIAKLG